jgi:hypothetical protein
MIPPSPGFQEKLIQRHELKTLFFPSGSGTRFRKPKKHVKNIVIKSRIPGHFATSAFYSGKDLPQDRIPNGFLVADPTIDHMNHDLHRDGMKKAVLIHRRLYGRR